MNEWISVKEAARRDIVERKNYLLFIALTIVSGLVGGAISNYVFMARPAVAQEVTQEVTKFQNIEANSIKVRTIQTSMLSFYGLFDEKLKAAFGALGDQTSLNFYENGKISFVLGSSSEGPFLKMNDKKGEMRIVLSMLFEEPVVTLLDEKGQFRAQLGCASLEITKTGSVENRPESSLILFDKVGKVIWKAP